MFSIYQFFLLSFRLVKGLVFDPVGKYLASQSDDKTLRIWKTSDWSQDTIIEKPFNESGGTTSVLRYTLYISTQKTLSS